MWPLFCAWMNGFLERLFWQIPFETGFQLIVRYPLFTRITQQNFFDPCQWKCEIQKPISYIFDELTLPNCVIATFRFFAQLLGCVRRAIFPISSFNHLLSTKIWQITAKNLIHFLFWQKTSVVSCIYPSKKQSYNTTNEGDYDGWLLTKVLIFCVLLSE